MKNKLLVISGPSGVGKGTLVKALKGRRSDVVESISCTTRAPREGEMHGREYYFLTKEEFQLFEDFVDTYGNRMAEESGYYFKKGFKIAIRLMMECCNDDDIKENPYENLF
jgi:predicted GTPase